MKDNNYKEITNSLLQGIQYMIKNFLDNFPCDKTINGIIMEIKDDNLYDVSIKNQVYTNIPSLFYGFKVNDIVKIKIPQNQYSQMYIEGKFNMNMIK